MSRPFTNSYLTTFCRNLIKQANNGEMRRIDTSEVLNIWRAKSQKEKKGSWRHSRFTTTEDKRERQQVT